MTDEKLGRKKERKDLAYTLIFGAIATIAFFIVLNRSDIAIDYMKKGLKLCVGMVIPSLFPFMVISELIIGSGVGERIGRILAKPMKRLFGVSGNGACVYLLGSVCGFPIGARTAVSMYDRGTISKSELTRLLTFCNNPGSAFVISAIGVALFGNRRIGLLIYICVILSSVIVGILGNIFSKKRNTAIDDLSSLPCCSVGIHTFTSAIQASALSMLTVCAYVAFFSAFVGCVGSFLSVLDLPDTVLAIIFGFFELSSGVGIASELGSPTLAILLCAAFAGWSGLSVHFQIITICSGRGVSFKYYFIAKAAQGVICAVLTGLALKFIAPQLIIRVEDVFLSRDNSNFILNSSLLCVLFFISSVCPLVINFLSRKRK